MRSRSLTAGSRLRIVMLLMLKASILGP
jgi:hypothetical protein